jgi:hypothetical protein
VPVNHEPDRGPQDLVVVPGAPRNAGGKVNKGVLRTQDEKGTPEQT